MIQPAKILVHKMVPQIATGNGGADDWGTFLFIIMEIEQKYIDRFWSKVDRSDPEGCWVWKQRVTDDGYARVKIRRQMVTAHRLAYELTKGPIPDNLCLDHLCRNRACCNPEHLEPVTTKENVLRGIGPAAVNAVKSECLHGHPFDEQNTYIGATGKRSCRTCVRERMRHHRNKTRLAA